MTEMINDNEKPVFLVNGFLESGKTSFINYTISEDYFHIDGNTLLLVTEEGEVEYDKKLLKREHITMVSFDDKESITKERLKELADACNAERIVIEWNGMWNPEILRFPDDWVLYQQITMMDGSTLDMYLNNMKALMGPMLKYTELLLINRCDDIPEDNLLNWKRQLRPMLMQGAEIVMENKFGEVPLEVIPEDLPYDISGDEIVISPENFGIWFFDCRDYPDRYKGKNVTFSACVMRDEKTFEKDCFVPGRMAMTCCEADMTFIGFMAHYKGISAYPDGTWVKLTARVDIKNLPEYEGEGPFLEVIKIAHTGEISEPVTF